MGAWMAYEFGGAAKPANVTGVDVVINVVDPNGNNYVVGTTTCNTDGTYSVTFTPQIQGQYQVIASFAGTNSYYPAFAHSTAYVNTLSSAGATPTPTPISNNTQTYILGSTAAIIIALAIAAVILALVLKKRP
jgi:hypothetical protein